MYKYILKRLLTLIPVILGVILIIFLIMDLTPGDPARLVLGNMASEEALESFRQEQGLNDPLPIRYGRYVLNICRGDLGASYKTGRSVLTELLDRFPASMLLAASSGDHVKPRMVLEALAAFKGVSVVPYSYAIHKLEVYADRGGDGLSRFVPLGELGEALG